MSSPPLAQRVASPLKMDDFGDPNACMHCRKKDAQIKKLKDLADRLIQQLEDMALEARGDLTFAMA